MPRSVHLLRLAAALACGLVAACDGGPGAPVQPPLTGTYVLQTVNGRALPHTLSSDATERYLLLAETIAFDASGSAARERTIREVRSDARRNTTYTTLIEAEYRLAGTRIEVGWFRPCPPNANCIGNDVGQVGTHRLVLESNLYATGPAGPPTLVYSHR
ncbi:MAG TPA: hypothetical protein VGR37_17635 [Longimicrobiaceae bacterium]|nr:hypothetical protein [Longimicrobiaceae bacterium]